MDDCGACDEREAGEVETEFLADALVHLMVC